MIFEVFNHMTFVRVVSLNCRYGNREVYNGKHTGAGEGQVVMSAEWKEVQRSGVCTKTHSHETRGKTGRTQERGKFCCNVL